MDIKLMNFQNRISKEYRQHCFQALSDSLESSDLSFENLGGRLCAWYKLEFSDKTIIRYTIVKNKTCYTVYFSETKNKK